MNGELLGRNVGKGIMDNAEVDGKAPRRNIDELVVDDTKDEVEAHHRDVGISDVDVACRGFDSMVVIELFDMSRCVRWLKHSNTSDLSWFERLSSTSNNDVLRVRMPNRVPTTEGRGRSKGKSYATVQGLGHSGDELSQCSLP